MRKFILTLIVSCFYIISIAQENTLSSGNNMESSSGKVTYSVGLIHYKEAMGSGGSSSAGSQIPFEILETLSLDEENLVSLKLFPNPTSDAVFLSLKKVEEFNYKLSDISGREIFNGNTTGVQTKINLNNLKSSIYILNIYKNNKLYESYKIIKK